jgi:hypothetical protein
VIEVGQSQRARELSHAPIITEPITVQCIHVEGISIEYRDDFVRVVGWVDLEMVEHRRSERRVVLRAAFPLSTARELVRELRKVLTQG